jgi:hypothetical protein
VGEATVGPTICAGCGAELDERSDVPVEERAPCPVCGSKARSWTATATGTIAITGGIAEATLTRAWDGNSLTLFGILYAIVVTVAGVIVAMAGTGRSWLWWGIYGVVSLGLLALALLVFPQAVIASMRWLTERAKKAPP